METNKNNSWIWVVIIVVIILIGIGFYVSYRENHAASYAPTADSGNVAGQTTPAEPEQTIDVRHQYADGQHTYAGSVDVPSPCDTISSQVAPNSVSNPISFTLAFATVVSTTTPAGQCAQVLTSRDFQLSFAGPQNATVNATLDGQPAILNVFELQPGQNIDSSIYQKG